MFDLGIDCKLYLNTGESFASPTWSEIDNARDVTVTMERNEADGTRRASGGSTESIAGLKTLGIEFDLLYDPDDSLWQALHTAFWFGGTVDILALDGAVTADGSQGPRFVGQVFGFAKSEPLAEGQMYSVNVKPSPNSSDAPGWWAVETDTLTKQTS